MAEDGILKKLARRVKREIDDTKAMASKYGQAAKDLADFGKAAGKAPVDGWSAVAKQGAKNRAAYAVQQKNKQK